MIIIHGNSVSQSRNHLNSELFKHIKSEILRLDGSKMALENLKQALESGSLFGQDKFIIIEGLFSSLASKRKLELLSYLKNQNADNLIIWEGKSIDGRSLTSFSKHKIYEYKVPTVIFKFLDSFSPKTKTQCIGFFRQAANIDASESILYMLSKRIWELIIVSDSKTKDGLKLPPWRLSILNKQAVGFGINGMAPILQRLIDIEYNQKSGQSLLPLRSELELFIAST